jgi:hypothetical protein
VVQGHPPWKSLGLYREVMLTPFWQSVDASFISPLSEREGRIQFNLGGSASDVDLDDVWLTSIETRESILPPGGFVVRYRFDDLGCRVDGAESPSDPGALRVLVVGNASTLGVGVHHQDTFSALLENLLNRSVSRDGSSGTVCGVPGYDARQAKLFHRKIAPLYRPQLVLLAVSPGEHPGDGETPAFDPEATAAEIVELAKEARQQGSRLGVVLFPQPAFRCATSAARCSRTAFPPSSRSTSVSMTAPTSSLIESRRGRSSTS